MDKYIPLNAVSLAFAAAIPASVLFGCEAYYWNSFLLAGFFTLAAVLVAISLGFVTTAHQTKAMYAALGQSDFFKSLPAGLQSLFPNKLRTKSPRQILDNQCYVWLALSLPLAFNHWALPIVFMFATALAFQVGDEIGLQTSATWDQEAKEAERIRRARPFDQAAEDAKLDRAWSQMACSQPDVYGYVSFGDLVVNRMGMSSRYAAHLVNERYAADCKQLGQGLDIIGDPEQPSTLRILLSSADQFVLRYRQARADRSLYRLGCDPDFWQEINSQKSLFDYV